MDNVPLVDLYVNTNNINTVEFWSVGSVKNKKRSAYD